MQEYLHGINAVVLILMMILVGFVAGKLHIMKAEHKQFIIKFLINIAVPAMCISNVFEQFSALNTANPLILFVPPLLSMLITLVLAVGAAKLFKLSHLRSGAFIVMCAFSNSMFVGLPLCKELFGDVAVPYVIVFYIINTLMFWTFGIALIQYSSRTDNSRQKVGDVLKKLATPPLLALILSIFLVVLNVKMPPIIMTFCGYLRDTVSPLALMYVGFIISETFVNRQHKQIDLSTCFVMVMRFIIAPIVTCALCRLFSVTGIAANVTITESAMPVMTQCVIISSAYGADEDYAASVMTLSVILCLLVMPVLYMILSKNL